MKVKVWLKRILFYFSLLVLWAVLARSGLWPEYLFPSPRTVLESLWAGFLHNNFIGGIFTSLARLALGYAISIVIGIPLGIGLASSKSLDQTIGTLVMGFQALPSICWLPLALLWFGLNEVAIVFVVVMGSLLSITLATTSGIKQVAPIYPRAARTLGASGWRLYVHVILPAAMPAIVAGLKQGWSFAWRSLMAGEMLFGNLGLGYLLTMGRELNDLSQVMAVMLVIIGVILVIDRWVFVTIDQKIAERWGFQED